ncbi:hypothetical protein BGX26_011456 [Mortierella sp. AD094]|nr:hypothetical protein BGX26_011456 [Mortierella sp. AD094]
MVLIMAACFISEAELYAGFPINWRGWVPIIISVILFFSYIYSLKGKPFLHKSLRAFLMFFLAAFMLIVRFYVLSISIKIMGSFAASNYCSPSDIPCYLCEIYIFLNGIVAVFVIMELIWTLKVGPLNPENPPEQQPQGVYPQTQKIEASHDAPIQPTESQYMYQQQQYAQQQHQPYVYQQQQQQQQQPQQIYQQPYQQPYAYQQRQQQHHQQQYGAPYQANGYQA